MNLAILTEQMTELVLTFALVFCRVGALALVLPPMVEGSLPARIRLGLGLVLAFAVFPVVAPDITLPRDGFFAALVLSEAAIGLAIGLVLRVAVVALQVCGTIIAQSTSLAQMMGTPGLDPSPAIGHLLVFSGIAFAMMMDMHVRLAISMAGTYDLVPVGTFFQAAALAEMSVGRIAGVFALAFSLAAPFTIAAFLYNLALGIANRAMPQLMVVLVGAPAIVGATLILLAIGAPRMIEIWMVAFGRVIDAPLGAS